jgi:hypothetical protein
VKLRWARIKLWLGLRPLASRFWDTVTVTEIVQDEVVERRKTHKCICYVGCSPTVCDACAALDPLDDCPRGGLRIVR